ncbi:Os01g0215600 [Oryza sativa Japonica Group]|uniref:Os01g0215600 protein n=1 Tax=Oryza sativa subsp. japonica TaxID=39947 RepID=A0A0P0V040_ORYSJ|nr:Os01g0215600 [Oryza sativa Japonica Group]
MLLLSYLGNYMCTPAEAVMSILSIASHRHVTSVAAAEDEHLRWSSMAKFGYAPAIETRTTNAAAALSTVACHPTIILNRSPPPVPLSGRDSEVDQSSKQDQGNRQRRRRRASAGPCSNGREKREAREWD